MKAQLTFEQREALGAVYGLRPADGDTRPFTYENEPRHAVLLTMVEDGYVVPRRRGHAWFWTLTDAGVDALKDGAK